MVQCDEGVRLGAEGLGAASAESWHARRETARELLVIVPGRPRGGAFAGDRVRVVVAVVGWDADFKVKIAFAVGIALIAKFRLECREHVCGDRLQETGGEEAG